MNKFAHAELCLIITGCPAGGDNATHLKLRADAGRLLLLVQVKQGLGDAVVERHAAQVPKRLDVQQVLQAQQEHTTAFKCVGGWGWGWGRGL